MENEENKAFEAGKNQPEGLAENEQNHYTGLASDGPVSTTSAKGKSDLQNTEEDSDTDDNSGDLSGNASGNSDAEDQ